jgi:putative DNA primase/helicase
VHTRAETILVKRNSDAIPTDVAALHRARFVYAVEPNRGARLDEALIKAATGGDPLTARFMRRDFFTFIPRFKLFLATNSKPRIVGVDHGIWRRVMLVPFTVTIPAEAQDKSLLSKLVQELPGILNWALEGERERRRLGGLRPPEIVLAATRRYRREQDRLGEWLGDSIFARGTDQDFVSTEDLYDDYQRWCAKSGEQHPMSKRALGDALEERGCPRDRRGNLRTRGHVGIKIADERDPVGGGW